MYSSFQLARKFLQHYVTASNARGHGMHSPFVFDFVRHVLQNNKNYQAPADIEKLRQELLADKRTIEVEDLGAGSRTNSSIHRSVADIAHSALKSKRLAQLLFRLGKHYQPASIVELGTSLGLTTAYLSKSNPGASVVTIEGSPSVATLARENLHQLGCGNVDMIQGNFDEALPALLDRLDGVDLAYIDGNHRFEPTVRYFEQLLPRAGSNTIFVFDDIHWSAEMEMAWKSIRQHPSVQYTIDIFFLGFVFFKDEFKVKQDFRIRF